MVLAFGFAGWSLLLLAVVVVWAAVTWNGFVRLGNRVDEAFSGVDVQLKRRHDLVPNLVEVVKAYARHERKTLEAVVDARSSAEAADSMDDRSSSEATLASSMRSLIALVEQYPELKADKNFRRLHADLVEIEDALQYARRYYNGAVRDFNTRIQQFPPSLLAALSSQEAREFFQLDAEGERAAPAIDFDGP